MYFIIMKKEDGLWEFKVLNAGVSFIKFITNSAITQFMYYC